MCSVSADVAHGTVVRMAVIDNETRKDSDMVYYKVQIGKGAKRHTKRYLSTHFKTKRTAKAAASRFAKGRVVKRRRVKHSGGR